MSTMRKAAMLAALGAAALAPAAAQADPPAVGAPGIPPVFVGAPTNQDPRAGQFAVSFDSTGRYLGIGTAPEPPLTIDVRPVAPRRQTAYSVGSPSAQERMATDRQFAGLTRQLRDLNTPRMAVLSR